MHLMYSKEEIELAQSLGRLKSLESYFKNRPRKGDLFYARSCPTGATVQGENVYLWISEESPSETYAWLPRFDDLLEIAKAEKVSFSQITDFLHRRRFADTAERLGLLTLLLELNRAKRA